MSQHESQINPQYDDPKTYSGRKPPDWDTRRKAVYQRDDWTCQSCGRKSGPYAGDDGDELHAHHIKPFAKGGSNSLSNLETLCEFCHNDSHDHDITRSDGPLVGVIGFIGDLRGVVTALVFAVWVGLLFRFLAWSAGIEQGALEDEALWIGVPSGIALFLLVVIPFYTTVLAGVGAAVLTTITYQGFGLGPRLAIAGVIFWPPALLGAWTCLRNR